MLWCRRAFALLMVPLGFINVVGHNNPDLTVDSGNEFPPSTLLSYQLEPWPFLQVWPSIYTPHLCERHYSLTHTWNLGVFCGFSLLTLIKVTPQVLLITTQISQKLSPLFFTCGFFIWLLYHTWQYWLLLLWFLWCYPLFVPLLPSWTSFHLFQNFDVPTTPSWVFRFSNDALSLAIPFIVMSLICQLYGNLYFLPRSFLDTSSLYPVVFNVLCTCFLRCDK